MQPEEQVQQQQQGQRGQQEQQQRGATHKVTLQPGELHRPAIAWPTVLLAAVSLGLWVSVAYVGNARGWPLCATLPASALSVYMSFTPLHEATHSNISRSRRWLNEAIGWLCVVPFFCVPYPVFRWIHLQHHKHTNDPALDPDHSHLTHVLPHILSILPNYVRQIAGHRRSIGKATLVNSALYLLVNAAAVAVVLHQGLGRAMLQYWVLPAFFGILLCAFVFDYVPHHPHLVTRSESLYGCTSVVGGLLSAGSGSSTRLLTCLLFGQNYHAIHHLYPTVPFYAYGGLWRRHQGAFLRAGVPLAALLR
uniref:Fatty acid desaturase domain-containing protein n=1 Tax=Zooxanthella nutricula TaxID=1333877 RepID=A0A7S2LX97_9DINO